jgi:hypothetical protein
MNIKLSSAFSGVYIIMKIGKFIVELAIISGENQRILLKTKAK